MGNRKPGHKDASGRLDSKHSAGSHSGLRPRTWAGPQTCPVLSIWLCLPGLAFPGVGQVSVQSCRCWGEPGEHVSGILTIGNLQNWGLGCWEWCLLDIGPHRVTQGPVLGGSCGSIWPQWAGAVHTASGAHPGEAGAVWYPPRVHRGHPVSSPLSPPSLAPCPLQQARWGRCPGQDYVLLHIA